MQQFMDEYNNNLPEPVTEKTATTADDFVELAMEADDEEGAIRYIKKALKLDPDDLDAGLLLAEYTTIGPLEEMEKLEKLCLERRLINTISLLCFGKMICHKLEKTVDICEKQFYTASF